MKHSILVVLALFSLSRSFAASYEEIDKDYIESSHSRMSQGPFAGTPPTGSCFVYKTSEGRYGKFNVLGCSEDNTLTIAFVTYDLSGNVYSSSEEAAISGTCTFDLDTGAMSSGTTDFWWEIVGDDERNLCPESGAVFALVGDWPVIDTAELPGATEGVAYSTTLAAHGGSAPYVWTLAPAGYDEQSQASTFADAGDAQGWNADDGCWSLDLSFAFPFYGREYRKVRVNSNGTLNFDDADFSNYNYDESAFLSHPMVSVIWDDLSTNDGDIYVSSSAESVTISWRCDYLGGGAANASITLYPDGRIVLSYGGGNENGGFIGLSAGDGETQVISPKSQSGSMSNADDIVFAPAAPPAGMSLSEDGVLSGTPDEPGDYLFPVVATDAAGETRTKSYTLTVAENGALRPGFAAVSPAAGFVNMGAETAQRFAVETTHPSGGAVEIEWFLDGESVGTGAAYDYARADDALHTLRCLAGAGDLPKAAVREWQIGTMTVSDPESTTVSYGQSATFSVDVASSLNATVTWLNADTEEELGTGETLTLRNVTATRGVRAIVKSALGVVTSAVATLTVDPTPAVGCIYKMTGPAFVGNRLVLRAKTYGDPTSATFAWKRDGKVVSTTERLDIPALAASDFGTYTFTMTNPHGTATTEPFVLAEAPAGAPVGWGASDHGRTTAPAGLTGVAQVASGMNFNLGLKTDGTVAAWGYNGHGGCDVPEGLADISFVAAGGYESQGAGFAVKKDGSVIAWGEPAEIRGYWDWRWVDEYDEEGNWIGEHEERYWYEYTNGWDTVSTMPADLTDVVKVAVGGEFAIALKADGSVVTWGRKGGWWEWDDGLGEEVWVEEDHYAVPDYVADVVDIVAGNDFAMVLLADGTAFPFGPDFDDPSSERMEPWAIDDVVGIGANANAWTKAVWFIQPDGIAFGTTRDDWYHLADVPCSDVTAIDGGQYHAMALATDGKVSVWGGTWYGQDRIPAAVQGNAVGIAAGGYHCTAILPDADGDSIADAEERLLGRDPAVYEDYGRLEVSGLVSVSGSIPASNAVVRLYDAAGTVRATAQADENGSYALSGIIPGNYFLKIEADGAVDIWQDGLRPSLDGQAPFPVVGGGRDDADFDLEPGQAQALIQAVLVSTADDGDGEYPIEDPPAEDTVVYLDMWPAETVRDAKWPGLIDIGEVAASHASGLLPHMVSLLPSHDDMTVTPAPVEIDGVEGETVDAKFERHPETGSVTIVTEPAGAEIWIDYADESVGITPLTVGNLSAAASHAHTLLIRKDGYLRPRPIQFSVEPEDTTEVSVPLAEESEPAMSVTVASAIPGMNIYVDYLPIDEVTPALVDGLDPASHAGSGWFSASHSILLRHPALSPFAPRAVPEWGADPETGDPVIPDEPPLLSIDAPNTYEWDASDRADFGAAVVEVPSILLGGESATVRWSVTNAGVVAAVAPWKERVFLVNDAGLTKVAEMTVSSSLDVGASVVRTATFVIPAELARSGDARVRVEIDPEGAVLQMRGGLADSATSAAIPFALPDFGAAWTAVPEVLPVGGSVPFGWAVTNAGLGIATAPWTERILLVNGAGETLLLEQTATAPIAAGASAERTASIAIPAELASGGDARIRVEIDPEGAVLQVRGGLADSAATGAIPFALPELGVTWTTVPELLPVGGTVELGWTVRNTGFAPAPAPWTERVWIVDAAGESILSEDDGQGGFQPKPVVTTNATESIAEGGSVVRTLTLAIDPDWFVEEDVWLVVDVDPATAPAQRSSAPDSATADEPSAFALPDLGVAWTAVPERLPVGGSVPFCWTVTNAGLGVATAPWTERIILVNGAGETLLLEQTAAAPIAAGSSAERTASIAIPAELATGGDARIRVEIDPEGEVLQVRGGLADSAATDAIPFAVPDLGVVWTLLPADEGELLPLGGQVEFAWTVTNAGLGVANAPWTERVVLVNGAGEFNVYEEVRNEDLASGAFAERTASVTVPWGAMLGGPMDIRVEIDREGVLIQVPDTLANEATAGSWGLSSDGWKIVIHTGTVSGSETWEADAVHIVSGTVTVASGARLTIEPGAIVKFLDGARLNVASGGNCVASGVIFTHIADDTIGGDTMGDGDATAPKIATYAIEGEITDDEETQYFYRELTVRIQNVSFRQRYPWNGLVDIDCDILCNDPATNISLQVSAKDAATGKLLSVRHVWLEGDESHTNVLSVTAGRYRLVWDAATDNPGFVGQGVVVEVQALVKGGLYMVIDLSGGPDAASYPVSHLEAEPYGGWTDEHKTTKLVLRRIEPGTFTMGSPSDEIGRRSNNEDQHEVTITKPFHIGVFEVTQRQWELVMGDNPSEGTGTMRPVEFVSYTMIRGDERGSEWPFSSDVDTTSFMGKLRARAKIGDGIIWDLPTEAQWEYACRAGTTTALNSGKNLTNGGDGKDPQMDEVGRYGFVGSPNHAAVGSYLPNAWGLYDMHGNVFEWCLDWYKSNLGTIPAIDPVGPNSGSNRTLRGGCWKSEAFTCRSASRCSSFYNCYDPSGSYSYGGFRLCCVVRLESPDVDGTILLGSGTSEAGWLDLREGPRFAAAGRAEALAYSPCWGTAESCTIMANGVLFHTATEEGVVEWISDDIGAHVLTHTAGDAIYTAQFTVLGNDVVLHDGTIAANETWSADKVHLVTETVTIPSGVTLAIEPGAVVKLMDGTGISVVSGGMCIASGAVLTHVADDSVGGDTMMDGGASQPAVGAYTLTGDIIEDDATEYRYLPPQELTSSITSDTKLRGYRTYIATNSVTVASGATLMLRPGTVVKFARGCSLTVNGTLNATGTRAAPIVFTSLKDDEHGGDTNGDGDGSSPDMGAWKNIKINGTVAMDFVSILYGSGESNSSDSGVLAVTSSGSLSLNHCTIAHCLYDGVFSRGMVTGRNTAIYDCDRGVNSAGGNAVFRNCVVDLCRWGVMAEGGRGSFYNCVITRFFGSSSWPTGYGVSLWSGGSLTVKSCDVWTDSASGQNWLRYWGTGCISADPRFADPDNGDFHLMAGSPCIDAGDSTQAPENDFFGAPRMNVKSVPDTGTRDSNGVCADIGLHEFDGVPGVPLPDLSAMNVAVIADGPFAPGDAIAITYVVTNGGAVAATGNWRDELSLVSERGRVISLGENLNPGNIPAGGSVACTASFTIPIVAEGVWRVRANANACHDLYEGANADNNAVTGADDVRVAIVAQSPDEVSGGTLKGGVPCVVRLSFAAGDVGRMVKFNVPAGVTVTYGFGFLPQGASKSGAVTADADGAMFLVPDNAMDVYVVLESDTTVRYEFTTESTKVVVTGVSPTTLPSSGTTTLTITGAGFGDDCAVELSNATGDIRLQSVAKDASGNLLATVDCAALTAGATYGIEVSREAPSPASATLPNAVNVAAAPGVGKFWAKLNVPESVREGRIVSTCFVEYGNSGTADIESPVLQVVMEGNGTLGYIDGLAGQRSLQFVAAGGEGSAGVLRPGETRRIRFSLRAGRNNRISLRSSVGSNYRPSPWTTAASYHADLSAAATRINLRGQDPTDYALVLDLARTMANGESTSAVCGRVIDENGEVVKGFPVHLTDSNTNTVAIVSTDGNGLFVFADVASGDYGISATRRIIGGNGISVVQGKDTLNLVLMEDSRVDCRVLVSGFAGEYAVFIQNVATREDIVPYDCGNDLFECRGLPYGCYVVNVRDSAGGLWRDVFSVDESGSTTLLLAEPVEPAEIRASIEFQDEYDMKAVLITAPGFCDYLVLDNANEFSLTNLPAGYYNISVFCGKEDGKAISESEIFSGYLHGGARTNIVAEMSGSAFSRNRSRSALTRGAFDEWVDRLVDPDAIKRAYLERLKEFTDLWYANRVVRPSGDYACVHNMEKYERDSAIWNSYLEFVQRYRDGANKTSMWQYIADWFWFGHKVFNMTFDVFIELYTRGKGSAWKMAVRDALFMVESYSVSEIAEVFEDANGNPVSEADISAAYAALSAANNASAKVNDAVTVWRVGQYSLQKLRGLRLRSSVSYNSKFMTEGAGKFLSKMNTAFTLGKDLIDTYDAGKRLWESGKDLQASYDEMVYMTYLLDVNIKTFCSQASSFNAYHLCPDEYAVTETLPMIEIVAPFAPQSWDPNEMVGLMGEGVERFLPRGEWATYTIYFENLPGFDAAQEVFVNARLDPALDWSTFEMCDVAFGTQTDLGLSGKSSGTNEVTMAGTNFLVRTIVTHDAATGAVFWYLRIVDPTTDTGWPNDNYAGFLPPNDETGRGEGHITYRVKVREDAEPGARIDASATIVFDYNDPIETDPAWWNTVAGDPVRVTFDARGNARPGTAAENTPADGAYYGLPTADPTREGYAFVGWALADGTILESLSQLPAGTKSVSLHAVWAAEYAVAFDANGGAGEMDALRMSGDAPAPLPSCEFAKAGGAFVGWATRPDGEVRYLDGSSVAGLTTIPGAMVKLYAIWAEAATTAFVRDGDDLQAAIDAAPDGGTVLVYPGAYAPIDATGRALSIRAVFGPDSDAPDAAPAVIDGGGEARCATLGDDAVLAGFVLRDGAADTGAGALGGALEDCRIESCRAAVAGGGAAGSALARCTVSFCSSEGVGGGLYEGSAENTVIDSCDAALFGGGAYHATLTGCTVYGCGAETGAGVAGCTVRNSIVWENRLYAVDKKGVRKLGNCANVTEGKKTLHKNACTYTDASPKPAGTGNLAKDPLFLDPENGDFRLAFASPVKNKGKAAMSLGDLDLGGLPRRIGAPDLGAREIPDGTPVPADYDGDGVCDAAYFDAASATWILMQSRDGLRVAVFGDAKGLPVPADYDGDGAADFATYSATAKAPAFRIRTQLGAEPEPVSLGAKGATPLAADLDGDGLADPVVFQGNAKKPSFTAALSGGGALSRVFGTKGAKAVAGDYDGDGLADIGCYTASASKPAFSMLLSGNNNDWNTLKPLRITLGAKGSTPCCGDFDGDGIADFAAYAGTAKTPILYRMLSTSRWREVRSLPFGTKGSRAATGDWDGDGVADPAIEYRGLWSRVTRDWTVEEIPAP